MTVHMIMLGIMTWQLHKVCISEFFYLPLIMQITKIQNKISSIHISCNVTIS